MRSPALTSSGVTLPDSSLLPAPAATTSPSCGFSLAESGMMMPPEVFSSASTRFTSTRSCRGRKFMRQPFPQCATGPSFPRTGRLGPVSKDVLALLDDECQRRGYGPVNDSVKARPTTIFQRLHHGPCHGRDRPIASTPRLL